MSETMTETTDPSQLEQIITTLAQTPDLLVACDYDGTLAPIVPNPEDAKPVRESIAALRVLASLPNTHVAVVSGRALADLAELSGLPDTVHLVGSHGSEFEPGFIRSLDAQNTALREKLEDELGAIAKQLPGATIETKPASVAFHYRNADADAARPAVERIENGAARWDGVFVKRGKMVLELAVVGANKGDALDTLRQRLAAHAVFFLGDDVTDEDAFERLRGPDVGVKVGDGETAASCRVSDTMDVAHILAELSEQRSNWVCGAQAVPIEDHSILSDQRTIALVSPDARVCWMCAPRIDSPALFAELLGGSSAGYFAIRPEDDTAPLEQHYVGDSLVLRTRFNSFAVTDYLDCTAGRPNQRAGRTDLVRIIEGTGKVVIEFAPRLDFGRTATQIIKRDDGLEIEGWPDPIVLRSPGVQWEIHPEGMHETARAVVDLADQPMNLSLRYGVGNLRPSHKDALMRAEQTEQFWSEWASRLQLPEIAPDQVKRSALMLKALAYGPTGAVSAAGTTSLPESIGGVRNWDYRFCWPRDAAVACLSLVHLGSFAEGMHFLDWMLGIVEGSISPDRIHPLYTVAGQEIPTEGEISELAGYAGSRPVRIGNAASHQVQLDVFGPIAELVYHLAKRDAPLTPAHWRILEALVGAVRSRWEEPDHGIWEIRAQRQHHIHSKVMCWLTVDRAIKSAELLNGGFPPEWADLRDAIKADVLENGWHEEAGAFTTAYDKAELDAAALWVGLSGMLEPTDERFIKTVHAIDKQLANNSGVYRYLFDDGLPGEEGVFNICTSWLIRSLLLIGETDQAKQRFEQYLQLIGPTGMLTEEHDPNTDLGLGNVPQAYSHSGLIDCAFDLANQN